MIVIGEVIIWSLNAKFLHQLASVIGYTEVFCFTAIVLLAKVSMGWFAMQRMLCVWLIIWASLLGCALSWDISSKLKSKIVDKLHPKSPLTNGGAVETSSSYFFSQKSFQMIGLSDKMVGVVEAMHINRPSKIQALSFSTILSGKHAVLGDQTGSGKTLAYLLPIVQRMEERLSEGKLQRSPERAPYVVVMTPTTELAGQVATVVREMANALKFRSSCFTSASDFDAEHKRLRLGSEVLVTTPGRLMELLKRKEISLSNVQSIVLDEVDVLFQDDTFPLPPIGQACPPTAQFIFTSATLPQSVMQQISKEFSDVVVLTGPGLHRVSPAVEEVLVDCSGPNTQSRSLNFVRENKQVALEKALETVSAERTLIFCNTIDNCRLVENNLQRRLKGKLVLPYHSAIDPKKRVENLAAFCRPLLKQPAILICTDRASRGIDFDRSFVDHVILWDFPREPSEYLRRVGRTGRAGRPGRATVFAYGKQVDAAKAVIRASVDGKKIEPENERTFQEHSLRSEITKSSPSVSQSKAATD